MNIGDLYEHNGQTEFPCFRHTTAANPNTCGPLGGGSFSLFKSVVRYRWNGADWVTEYVELETKVYGSGK